MIHPIKNPGDNYFINLFNHSVNHRGVELDMNETELEDFCNQQAKLAETYQIQELGKGRQSEAIDTEIIKNFYSFEGDYYMEKIKEIIKHSYEDSAMFSEGFEGVKMSQKYRSLKALLIRQYGERKVNAQELSDKEVDQFLMSKV